MGEESLNFKKINVMIRLQRNDNKSINQYFRFAHESTVYSTTESLYKSLNIYVVIQIVKIRY